MSSKEKDSAILNAINDVMLRSGNITVETYNNIKRKIQNR